MLGILSSPVAGTDHFLPGDRRGKARAPLAGGSTAEAGVKLTPRRPLSLIGGAIYMTEIPESAINVSGIYVIYEEHDAYPRGIFPT